MRRIDQTNRRARVGKAGRRGQALTIFAICLFVLLGMMALALETGWARYVQRQAQSAADAAALAAAVEAYRAESFEAGAGVATQGAAECPSSGNLQTGCDYASANGFDSGGDNGRQSVLIAAGTSATAPGVPGVPVDYWVQVTARHNLPQLFSGVIASAGLSPAATATAAVRTVAADASMYLLNRKEDCFVSAAGLGLVCGEDFLGVGDNYINAPMGIYMASSNGAGLGLPSISAGTTLGAVEVDAPFTYLMGNGAINPLLGLGPVDWATTNGFPDGEMFVDPMAGKAQPPAPTGLTDRPIPGGVIVGGLTSALAVNVPPGNYYATTPGLLGGDPTGLPVTIVGHVRFSDGAATPCGGFCEYVFYGGLVTAALSNVEVSPGRYVFAGAQPVSGGPGAGLTVGANATLKDRTALLSSGQIGAPSDAGEIFIFTDADYPGLGLPADLASSGISFPQVRAGVLASLGAEITLHGLNPSSTSVPSELAGYAPVLVWQDRANTTLKYDADGFLDRTCAGICDNLLSVPGSQEMIIQATRKGSRPGTNLWGTVYGPRGSWLTVLGILPGDSVAGPLQIITGSLQMTLSSRLDLEQLPTPVSRIAVGLIQ